MKSIHKYNNPLIVAKEIYRETLIRSLFNEAIKGYEISGSVLDIGSKSIKSGYYKKIKIKEGTNITFTDLHEGEGVVKLDVEKDFPFEDSTFDCVISFHLFEHVFCLLGANDVVGHFCHRFVYVHHGRNLHGHDHEECIR